MAISHWWPRPPLLLGVAVFAAIALLTGREVLPRQEPPALAVANVAGQIRVALGDGFPVPAVRHLSDGMTLDDVTIMTDLSTALAGVAMPGDGATALVDGMALAIDADAAGNRELRWGWMPARQRLALGIPLHPDRMSRADWESLPGIGPHLAARIESDRQKYGDFGSLAALERVAGLGQAKLRVLRPYFTAGDN
jgi:competence protein ComEA